MAQRIPILMYHALWPALDSAQELRDYWDQDPQLRDPGARLYALDVSVFADQMRRLAAGHGPAPSVGSWGDLCSMTSVRSLITFDDGHQSNCELALPVLKQLGLMAVFFITTDWIGRPGFLTEHQIRHLRREGMLIGSHGTSHRYFSDLSSAELRRELTDSKARLESILDEPVEGLSLPGGRSQRLLRKLATDAGYRHIFTSTPALADPVGDPLGWPRIPLTHRLPADFLDRLLAGDDSSLRRIARRARWRAMAQRILGNQLYDRLRGSALKRKRQ